MPRLSLIAVVAVGLCAFASARAEAQSKFFEPGESGVGASAGASVRGDIGVLTGLVGYGYRGWVDVQAAVRRYEYIGAFGGAEFATVGVRVEGHPIRQGGRFPVSASVALFAEKVVDDEYDGSATAFTGSVRREFRGVLGGTVMPELAIGGAKATVNEDERDTKLLIAGTAHYFRRLQSGGVTLSVSIGFTSVGDEVGPSVAVGVGLPSVP